MKKRKKAVRKGPPPRKAAMKPETCRKIRSLLPSSRKDKDGAAIVGMTQEEFAQAVGVKPVAVSLWETGKVPISHSRALAIRSLVKDEALAAQP